MISEDKVNNLSWNVTPPGINDIKQYIPENLVKPCPNLIKNANVDLDLLIEASKTSHFKQLTKWSKENLPKIMTTPGISLLKIRDCELDNDRLKSLYYIISLGLGKLNDRYGELFEVKDQNLDYKKDAIPVSKTNASTGFHTDSTSFQYSPDIVGLLCLQPGKNGGESILANAASLYLWLKEFYPDSIPILSKDIIRDVITPGSKIDIEAIKKNRFPIFSYQAGLFKFRYMRYWIISGHEKCNKIMPKELIKGLDQIDKFFERKEHQINYNMERGDILYINNNFICHNRTEYTDYNDLERKRTLVRTWINP
jgi:hypothetical protein